MDRGDNPRDHTLFGEPLFDVMTDTDRHAPCRAEVQRLRALLALAEQMEAHWRREAEANRDHA